MLLLRALILPASFRWKALSRRQSLPLSLTSRISECSICWLTNRSRMIASKEFGNDVNAARRYIRTAVCVVVGV